MSGGPEGVTAISKFPRGVAALVATSFLLGSIGYVAAPDASGINATATFVARGSVEQVYVTGAAPAAQLGLVNRAGRQVASQSAGPLGGVVFRRVLPGSGYRVRLQTAQGTMQSGPITVLSTRSAPPSTAVYNQQIPEGGYGYLTTRDGTKLAINVQLPGPVSGAPFPTLIEYSGYGYANPKHGESSISELALLLGYAVVDVNMRGTGCSGGSFDYFEQLQNLDGYDVIETVARQPWVMHHKVGMMGISYGGISQLFVAQTDPPSLAGITPLSVIDSTATTLYPGGILNTGFAVQWAKDRAHDAQPASKTTGQSWAYDRIQAGDMVCKANQVLHPEAVDPVARIRANSYYIPAVADPLDPITFVHQIAAPVFLACQWTDEQTGGHCADLASHFTGTHRKWFTFTNGTHIDSLDPATFNRWFDFLELYVAQRAPRLPAGIQGIGPAIFNAAMGVDGVNLPADPIQSEATYGAALTAFDRLPAVRVLFDSGGGSSTAGNPVDAFEHSFTNFPVPGTQARSWYLAPAGALAAANVVRAGSDNFNWDPSARPPTSFTGDTGSGDHGLWTATPTYNWAQSPPGTALSYLSAPLTANTVVVGGGAVQAWIRATVPSVDLQATVSEVRPDGQETFVQSGWLRASVRKLDPRASTLLMPVLSLRQHDAAPLPSGKWAEVTIPLYFEGHAYRAGSRIRIIISAPGGDQPVWTFGELIPASPTSVSVGYSAQMPSRLVLPVVPGVSVPTGLPPCPGLRGEPCRPYVPFATASP